MKPGDVFINPYVRPRIGADNRPNPMHKLIYINRSSAHDVYCIDFNWRRHKMYMLKTDEETWKVIGRVDLLDIISKMEEKQ